MQRQFVQSTNSVGLSLVLAVDKVQPSDFKYIFEDIHALLRFNLPPVHHESEITEEFIASFRGFWRAINVLQLLPMLHLEFPDLDTLDLPKIFTPGPSTSEIDLAWAKVRAEVLEEYWPLVDTLIAAGVPVPNSIGEEVTNGSRIIGSTELGWSEQNVWVTDDDTLLQENLIFWDLTTATIPEVVAEIITRIERVKGNNS